MAPPLASRLAALSQTDRKWGVFRRVGFWKRRAEGRAHGRGGARGVRSRPVRRKCAWPCS